MTATPTAPARLANRELSWLEFNARVLEEAQDASVQVLERLKFLSIFSSNLDEFFMVRVAGIWRQIDGGVTAGGTDGLAPRDVLDAVSKVVHRLVGEQHQSFIAMLPELARHGVDIMAPQDLGPGDRTWAEGYFRREILPLLTPMAIDPGHPFPYLTNKAICLIAELDPLENETDIPSASECVIHLPAAVVPRFIRLPEQPGAAPRWRFLILEDLIRLNLDRLFVGYRVRSCSAIRVTRDSELDMPEAEAEDLLSTIEDAVRQRRMGSPVRLQYERGIAPALLARIQSELELVESDLYPTAGPTALTDVLQLYNAIDRPDLKDPTHHPLPAPAFAANIDPFEVIRAGDVVVHHPYEEFDSVVRLLQAAADDPDVLAVKMTLYRVGSDSKIAQALERAARNGKQVSVLVELRARFSEEGNIVWARRLEATGAHVVYGIVGLKTHCKAALVVRRERDGIRRYVHLGTGNYNERTARLYTDYSLFTAHDGIGEEVNDVFNLLTGYVRPPSLAHLVLAPTHMRRFLIELIRNEVANAQAGRPAGILAKLNALADPALIEELYAASAAGVRVELMIRGVCCLRPGVPGLSEHIRVRRIVDRFLEHERVLRVENGGQPRLWLSSADWMPRNLGGRIEILFPILDPLIQARIESVLQVQLSDTVKATELGPDGPIGRVRGPKVRSQAVFVKGPR